MAVCFALIILFRELSPTAPWTEYENFSCLEIVLMPLGKKLLVYPNLRLIRCVTILTFNLDKRPIEALVLQEQFITVVWSLNGLKLKRSQKRLRVYSNAYVLYFRESRLHKILKTNLHPVCTFFRGRNEIPGHIVILYYVTLYYTT